MKKFLLLIPVAFVLALAFAVPAKASVMGMCESSQSNSYCWRTSPNDLTTHIWTRDISGDTNQQFTKGYWGTPATQTWLSDCLSDLISSNPALYDAIKTIGVYHFDADNYYVGSYNGNVALDTSNSNHCYDAWGWTSHGTLFNIGQTDYWTNLDFLCGYPTVGLYNQMFVRGSCSDTWTAITV